MFMNKSMSPIYTLFRNIFILIAAVYLYATYYVWTNNLKRTENTLHHINSILKQGVRTTLKGHELILRGLGSELVAQGALDNPELGQQLIDRMKEIDPGMAGFGLARPDGRLVVVSSLKPGQAMPNLATNKNTGDSFEEVINSQNLRTGRPYFFKSLGSWVVPIRTPIFNKKGELVAVMTAGYKIEDASVAWSNLALPENTRIAIARSDGFLVYVQPLPPGNREDVLKLAYGRAIHPSVLQKLKSFGYTKTFTTLVTPNLPEKDQFILYDYINEYDLHIGVLLDKSAVMNTWLRLMFIPTLLFVIFIVGGIWAFWHASRRQELADKEIINLTSWQEAVLNAADYSIISTDTRGTIVSFNQAAQRMLGYETEEVIGKATPEIIHDKEEVIQRAKELSQELGQEIKPGFDAFVAKCRIEGIDEREWTYIRKDNFRFPVFLSITPLYGDKKEIIGYLGVAADLSEKKLIQENLRSTEARYRMLFDSAVDATFMLSGNQFVDCNPATLKLFDCERKDIIGKTPERFSPQYQPDGGLSSDEAMEKINAAFNGEPQFFEWQHLKLDGTPFEAEVSLTALEMSSQQYLLATVRDITDRKQLEAKLIFQSQHDSLTDLPNRILLHQSFREYINRADSENKKIILMLLDLDRFKEINDTLGHHIGDEVLKQIGPRLRAACSKKDILIARLGGDEFIVLAHTNKTPEEVKTLAESLVLALRKPFTVKGIDVTIGVSIGIATYPQHGNDSHELLRAADVAMYQAKKLSVGVMAYDNAYDNYSTQRLGFANELTRAVQENQLVLHYQPKVDVLTGKVIGFEGLVRWQHPQQGLLFPDAFIDLVEMSEVIHEFTQSVIDLAVHDKNKMQQLGYKQPVAINLSARNLYDDSCLNYLETALKENNLSYSDIEIELTESAVMHEPERSISVLNNFNNKGINIAIDDFGTGYSSLSYLRQLPVSALKIDRSFVMDMILDEQDRAIVQTTITLAKSLNLKVIAEGVETEQALDLLRTMQCDHAQGYGICRPKPLDEILDWLSATE